MGTTSIICREAMYAPVASRSLIKVDGLYEITIKAISLSLGMRKKLERLHGKEVPVGEPST